MSDDNAVEQIEVTDLSNSDVVEKYKVAAEVANKALAGVVASVAAGKPVVELCTFGDLLITKQCENIYKKNKSMDKGIAFPTCVSVNECLAHFSPLAEESFELKDGDVVKIDLGAQVDGYIAVVARTVVVGASAESPTTGPVADAALAAYYGARASLNAMKIGAKNSVVTDTIAKVAERFGVNTVQGVLSHQMKRWVYFVLSNRRFSPSAALCPSRRFHHASHESSET